MKSVYIGTYPLGDTAAELYGLPDYQGGALDFKPGPKRLPRLDIGLGEKHWREVVDTLLHESAEYLMMQNDLAFDGLSIAPSDTQNRTFIFNHGKFCTLCRELSEFLIAALPDLARVWKKFKPKK
jgi:hypothetical protein